jgi:hypothetical protein
MHALVSDNNDGKGGYLPTTPLMVDLSMLYIPAIIGASDGTQNIYTPRYITSKPPAAW